MKTLIALAVVLGCSCVVSKTVPDSICGEVRDDSYLKSVRGKRCKTFAVCTKEGAALAEMMCAEGTWFNDETIGCTFTSEDDCPDMDSRDPSEIGARPYHVMENNCTMWIQSTMHGQDVMQCERYNTICFSNSKGVCVNCDHMTEEDLQACGYNVPQNNMRQ